MQKTDFKTILRSVSMVLATQESMNTHAFGYVFRGLGSCSPGLTIMLGELEGGDLEELDV